MSPEDFYLVTGVVFDWSGKTRFKDKDCSSASPNALYGCGTGVDGAPLSSLGDFGPMAGFNLGVGYVVVPALRLEAVIQYRPGFSFEGRANFVQPKATDRQAVSANLASLSGMLAAYLDLAESGLPRLGPFSPFTGGGVGLSRIGIDETRMAFLKTTTVVPRGTTVNFRLDADRGSVDIATEEDDPWSCLALHGFRHRRNRQDQGSDCLARRKSRPAGDRSCRNQSESVEPGTSDILALRVLKPWSSPAKRERHGSRICRDAVQGHSNRHRHAQRRHEHIEPH